MAGVAGGVTTVLDMPNNNPPITNCALLERKRELIKGHSYVNYGLYVGATESNLEELKKAEGIAGIKIYLGKSTGGLVVENYEIIEKILAQTNRLVAFHCEDDACLKEQSAK